MEWSQGKPVDDAAPPQDRAAQQLLPPQASRDTPSPTAAAACARLCQVVEAPERHEPVLRRRRRGHRRRLRRHGRRVREEAPR